MALRRYRVVRLPNSYAVVDHGEPNGTETIGPNQAGEGKTVPRYQQDGDPADPTTSSWYVWTSKDASPAGKRSARAEANQRNADWEQKSDVHDEVLSELDYEIVEPDYDTEKA